MFALLLVHAAATWFMTGLIWFVQVVHYPLMARVGDAGWTAYEAAHVQRTTWIVGPAMLVELASAALLLVWATAGGAAMAQLARLGWIGLALLLVIWLSTAFLQVPLHGRLAKGTDPQAVRRLVRTNWVRTIAWSARSVVAVALIAAAIAQATGASTT